MQFICCDVLIKIVIKFLIQDEAFQKLTIP